MTSQAPSSSATDASGTVLAPHAPLPAYYADEAERHRYLERIFDATAGDYDRIERMLAWGSGRWYRRRALSRAGLGPGLSMIDVGIGTGLVAREALQRIGPQGRLVGVDPSTGMLAQVRLPGVSLRCGRAEALPCDDADADFLSLGYALRHIADVHRAFAEFHRVLRPGGRLLILEITRPEGRAANALLRAYMRRIVPGLARLVGRQAQSAELWRYYWDTIEACLPPDAVLAALRQAGFTEVRREVELGIFSAYTARRPPLAA